jgi:hypothetical protein
MTAIAAAVQPSTTSSPDSGIGQDWVAGSKEDSIAWATGATGKADATACSHAGG